MKRMTRAPLSQGFGLQWRAVWVCLALLLECGAQRAVAGGSPVALQTADPSCRTTTTPPPIYVDCGNGTVTDNRTRLVWLKDANCIGAALGGTGNPLGRADWFTAMEFVSGLSDIPSTSAAARFDCGLSDGSSPGEWRLPSVNEWEAMVADALGEGGGPNCTVFPPTITNDSGFSCWVFGTSSFTGVLSSDYWSSTTNLFSPTFAWEAYLSVGRVGGGSKAGTSYVWPVRGGQ